MNSEYINADTEVTIQRNKCGHDPFDITPKYFRGNHFDENKYGRCKQCKVELIDSKFKKELLQKTKGSFTHKGLYTDRRNKIIFIHKDCGREFLHPPDMLLRYQRCKHCEYDKMIDELKKYIKEKYNGSFEVLDTYKTGDESVDIKCVKCGATSPRKIKNAKSGELGCRGKGCSPLTLTQKEVENRVVNLLGKDYKVIDTYKNSSTPLTIRHLKCNYDWVTRLDNIEGRGCPNCFRGIRRNHEDFIRDVEVLGDGEYTLLTEFKGTKKYITMKHNVCRHTWDVIASSFIRGHRCPQCMIGKSHDSVKINDILSETDLFYLNEYTMEKCRNIRLLPFDFAIIKNKQLLLIEYDGEQHFREIEAWGGEDGLLKTQHRDQIKNQYCIDNNIPLVRIPYWESDQLEHIVRSVLDYFDLKIYNKTDKDLVEKYLVDSDWNYEKYLDLHLTNS